MLGKCTKILGSYPKEKSKVSSAVEAQDIARGLFPRKEWGKRSTAIYELYKFLIRNLPKTYLNEFSFSERRARSIYDGELRKVDSEIMDTLREEQARQDAEETRQELLKAARHMERLDAGRYRSVISEIERAAAL